MGPDNATANVENAVLNSFKQFSATEKLRVNDRQRLIAREHKAVKLNDLKKFSQSFKLHTPVPQDLVPILARDEGKQHEIVEKSRRAALETKTTPPKPAAPPTEQKPTRAASGKTETAPTSANAPAERQNGPRPRAQQPHYGPAAMRADRAPQHHVNQAGPRNATGTLATRLTVNQQQHRAGTVPYNQVPQPVPIQDMRLSAPTGSASASSAGPTPTSALSARFNARAPDFRPNPAANTFLPGANGSTGSSPRPSSRPDSAAKPEPPRELSDFFASPPPPANEVAVQDAFSHVKRMKKLMQEGHEEHKLRDYAFNGGIPQAYRTPPTWDTPRANENRTHLDMFEKATAPQLASHMAPGNGTVPHPHPMPPHFVQGPNAPQGPTPHHTPRHPPAQPHHGQTGPHFDGHHMQFSQSASSVHPSPRAMAPFMYSAQPQPMPMYPPGPPMPAYGMGPGMPHVAAMQAQGRPPYVNAAPSAMGGHAMTSQPSNGPFVPVAGNPPMQGFAPGAPAYPHYPAQMAPPPGPNSYPSPRHGGAQMMSHQGSQQGHPSQQVMYLPPGSQVPPMYTQMGPGTLFCLDNSDVLKAARQSQMV